MNVAHRLAIFQMGEMKDIKTEWVRPILRLQHRLSRTVTAGLIPPVPLSTPSQTGNLAHMELVHNHLAGREPHLTEAEFSRRLESPVNPLYPQRCPQCHPLKQQS